MRWLDGIINSMDMSLSKLRETLEGRQAWRATVHGVTKSQTRQSNQTTRTKQIILMGFPGGEAIKTACNDRSGRSPEKEMTTHSSILPWRIPWTKEPGGL